MNKNDYAVVSKPSLANKAEANVENERISVIEKKIAKMTAIHSSSSTNL